MMKFDISDFFWDSWDCWANFFFEGCCDGRLANDYSWGYSNLCEGEDEDESESRELREDWGLKVARWWEEDWCFLLG